MILFLLYLEKKGYASFRYASRVMLFKEKRKIMSFNSLYSMNEYTIEKKCHELLPMLLEVLDEG
jgi:GTP-dependent phosphoenolpyruvate carboxykinase